MSLLHSSQLYTQDVPFAKLCLQEAYSADFSLK